MAEKSGRKAEFGDPGGARLGPLPAPLPAAAAHGQLPGLLPALRGFLRRMLRDHDDAQDLAQEAAARALAARQVPRDPAAYRSWLYRIAKHAAIDELRRRTTREDGAPLLAEEPLCHHATIDALSVRQGLMRLSHDHRVILLLVDVQGSSYQEAAAKLGIAPGTVMSRVARARAALLATMAAGNP